MNRREEREIRLKLVREALFWRNELRKERVFSKKLMRAEYRGKISSLRFALKVVRGFE